MQLGMEYRNVFKKVGNNVLLELFRWKVKVEMMDLPTHDIITFLAHPSPLWITRLGTSAMTGPPAPLVLPVPRARVWSFDETQGLPFCSHSTLEREESTGGRVNGRGTNCHHVFTRRIHTWWWGKRRLQTMETLNHRRGPTAHTVSSAKMSSSVKGRGRKKWLFSLSTQHKERKKN